jgi:nickel-dependent lactate racemase
MSRCDLKLPFGKSALEVEIPTRNLLGVFLPRETLKQPTERRVLEEALARPQGTGRLRDLARAGQKVVIVISDMTRPCPSARLLPPVLDELGAAGVPDEDITVVVALGLHRPMTAAELELAVGSDLQRRVPVVNHDPTDTVKIGVTLAGTPVELSRAVVETDLRICLGNLEFHYFAGFSGGAKAILPGCASKAAVTANHSMMVHPEARAGCLERNPVRADIEEASAMLGVDFILNVLLDEQSRIVGAVAGDVTEAHRRGSEQVVRRDTVEIPQQADIVIAGAGGYPKDLNLYQAQKALENAAHAVQTGGVIILAAECAEGFGNDTFETWMKEASSPQAVLKRIQQEFVLGGHKAAAIASTLQRAKVYLVSAMPFEDVRACGMVPFDSLHEAVQCAFQETGQAATVMGLPYGGSSLPVVTNDGLSG